MHFTAQELVPTTENSPDGTWAVGSAQERAATTALDFTTFAASSSGSAPELAPPGGGTIVRKNKLVIIMVGLPGRGKTFLCSKLLAYLNW